MNWFGYEIFAFVMASQRFGACVSSLNLAKNFDHEPAGCREIKSP